MTFKKLSEATSNLDCIDCDLNNRDRIYNRVARRQPAYISLMFPVIWFYIYVNETDLFDDQTNVLKYIFNCIAGICIFMPALFFMYVQLIRGLSEIVTEALFFKLINPVLAPFRNNFLALGKDEKKKLVEFARTAYNIDIKDITTNKNKRTNTILKKDLKQVIKYIRISDIVKNNNIAFEYNCVYGFFRNLVGGVVVNLSIYYAFLWSDKLYHSNLMDSFYDISVALLWALFVIALVYAWCSRVRQVKRECQIFLYHQASESHDQPTS